MHCQRLQPGSEKKRWQDHAEEGAVEFLGEMVGREGRESLDLHIDAIRNFSIVDDAPGMRRFLGNFGWVRPHYPKEVAIALPALTAQLRKDAAWPMPAEAVSSQRAVQAMAARLVKLAVLDEIAAITRTRPLEQIADSSGYGWGGTVYQLSPDRRLLNVLGGASWSYSRDVLDRPCSLDPRHHSC